MGIIIEYNFMAVAVGKNRSIFINVMNNFNKICFVEQLLCCLAGTTTVIP